MSRKLDPNALALAREIVALAHQSFTKMGLPGEMAHCSAIDLPSIPEAVFKADNFILLNSTFQWPLIGSDSRERLLDACASWAVHRLFRQMQAIERSSLKPNTYDKPKLHGFRSVRWQYYRDKIGYL